MFGNKRKTLYEMLGVGRDATLPEIESAYKRRRAEMRGPDIWIHPLIAAKTKVAYETLRNPLKREAYDRKLRTPAPPQEPASPPPEPPASAAVPSPPPPLARPRRRYPGRSGWWGFRLGMGAVLAVAAGAGGYFLLDGPDLHADKEYTGAEIAEKVSPYLGRLRGALVGGTRDLGVVLATAADEMVTPCREMPAGMVLTLQVGAASPRAELVRVHEELGLCVFAVRGAAPEFTFRTSTPAPGEPLYAIVREASGPPLPLRVIAGRALADPKGAALQIDAQAPLPNGTPIFDAQARLVGLVAVPHGFGDGIVAALGAARIASPRR